MYVPLDPASPVEPALEDPRARARAGGCCRWSGATVDRAVPGRGGAKRFGRLAGRRAAAGVRFEFDFDRRPRRRRGPVRAPTDDDRAHPLYLGIDGHAEGRRHHARQRDAVRRVGRPYFGMNASDRSPAIRRCISICRSSTSSARSAAGAELHLVPPELNVLPNKIGDFIRELGAHAMVLGAVGAQLHGEVRRRRDRTTFRRCERVLWCGEVLPTPALMYWMERLPHVQFTNLYGPTETTIASSYYTVPALPARRAGGHSDRRRVRGRRTARARRVVAAGAGRRDRQPLHRRRRAGPGYWRDPETNRRRVRALIPSVQPSGFTRPATSPESAKTASSTSSAARTHRSRAAATASSSEKSRPR